MGFIKSGFSAIGKLFAVIALLITFLIGMVGMVYLSLLGEEIRVPEITGKDFLESEKELASLGLKIKKRADRPSDKMNTILEQLPKAGETVKTGQIIYVVVSKLGGEGDNIPNSLKKDIEADDTEKIEEMISDKPRKPKANTNANAKKKADTTRDLIANNSNSNSNDSSNLKGDDANKKDTGDKNKNASTGPGPKPQATPTRPGPGDQRLRGRP